MLALNQESCFIKSVIPFLLIFCLLFEPGFGLIGYKNPSIFCRNWHRQSCGSKKDAPLFDMFYYSHNLLLNGQNYSLLHIKRPARNIFSMKVGVEHEQQQIISSSNNRRHFFQTALERVSSAFAVITTATVEPCSAAVERAVGGSESKCQQLGNCLENLELDGAIGWSWGGKNRCDASDPRCGTDGKLSLDVNDRSIPPVPDLLGNKITHVVEMDFLIGREREQGTMRIGLYGDAHPDLVRPFLDFFDERKGLAVSSRLLLDDGYYGAFTAPLYFSSGGILNSIYPNQRIDFGVPSQAAAYARSKGRSKAGDDFVPQPRPNKVTDDSSFRKHDCAGLFSAPSGGLGYGGSGLESNDQAYASAFQISASAVPSMDTEGRRVIGQAIDDESMAMIQRLASIPTNKGIKGIVPGLNYGPPLIKVSIEGLRLKQSTTI